MKHLAIFASGKGTNAAAIIEYFRGNTNVCVSLVVTGNPKAGVTAVAKNHDIPLLVISRQSFNQPGALLKALRDHGIDFIALAGFLWLIPREVVESFEGNIINIHPSLLPAHGGKGMYGEKVHVAVLNSKANESGITIHHVNERFDDGAIIFQAKCPVLPGDDADTLAARIHELEHRHYPRIIEQLLVNSKHTVTA